MAASTDKSGREQLGKNVITSWLSHFVFIIFGFVMPRAIHESVGQEALGVWDFGWAIVSYLSLAMIGIGSSVNRHVSRYRASGDTTALSSTISSVAAIQLAIGTAVFLTVVALAIVLPDLLGEKLGDQAEVAGVIFFFLGSSLAVQMAFDVFRGILTGCHRWTTHNGLNAGGYTVSSVGMLLVLLNGGGLKGMAIVYFVVTILTELVRVSIARKVCPEIDFRINLVNKADISKMVRFGVKTILIYLPKVIIQQTVVVLVVANLGVSMLAVLARPLALVSHITTLINKFAYVLTPTAGALQGGGKDEELKEFALMTMRAGWIFAVLPIAYLVVLGDRIIELWMGPGYANLEVIAILAAGSMLMISQSSLVTIMTGMDKHGQITKYGLIVSAITVVVGLIVVSQLTWTLAAAAWLIVIPSSLGVGLVALVVGCNVLQVSASEYMSSVMRDPLVLMVVSVSALILTRIYGPQDVIGSILAGVLVHSIVSGLLLHKDILVAIKSLRKKKGSGTDAAA